MSISAILYAVSLLLIAIGLYGLLANRNLVRMVIGLNIADLGVNIFLVTAGYVEGGIAPIFTRGAGDVATGVASATAAMVDPVPQALVLTAIVIGFGITAVALTLVMRIYAATGTIDSSRLRGLKW